MNNYFVIVGMFMESMYDSRETVHKNIKWEKVAVVLLNYDGWQDTLECLNSLDKIIGNLITTIVVDNDSPSKPADILNEVRSHVDHFIQAPRNGGFAYGNNLGIRWALENGYQYILLLNNDTVVEQDFLEKMLNKFKDEPNLGVLGCRILNYYKPERVWFNGAKINWWKGIGQHYDFGKGLDMVCYHEKNDYISGCVFLVKDEVFYKVGLLDEDYFMYFEDVAFSQAVLNAGYKIDYAPDAIVYHKIGASGGGGSENWASVYYGNLSRKIFLSSKYYKDKRFHQFVAKVFFCFSRSIKFFIYLIKGDWRLMKAMVKATMGTF
jgi:GT2 family glycosyltransferase